MKDARIFNFPNTQFRIPVWVFHSYCFKISAHAQFSSLIKHQITKSCQGTLQCEVLDLRYYNKKHLLHILYVIQCKYQKIKVKFHISLKCLSILFFYLKPKCLQFAADTKELALPFQYFWRRECSYECGLKLVCVHSVCRTWHTSCNIPQNTVNSSSAVWW